MLALLAACAAIGCPGVAQAAVGGGGGGATNTSTTSTFDHRYDLYYGTVSFTRAGEASPYLSRDAFAGEIRVDEAAASRISTDLGGDPRIASGFAGTAPDGGSWLTAASRPGWWRFPNGTARPESEPTFDAQSEFQRQMDPAAELAGRPAECTDTTADTTLRGTDFAMELFTTTTFGGPVDVLIGEQRNQTYTVQPGSVNVNTEESFLVVDAHRVDRRCVFTSATLADDSEPAPDPATACRTEEPTIEGTKRNDKLTGTEGADVIFAGAGNDKVTGLGGRDILCLGVGNDKAAGGEGNDALNGDKGNDKVSGDAGNDNAFGSTGRDKVLGGLGDDLLNGGPTDGDKCDGGDGTDTTNRGCEKSASIP